MKCVGFASRSRNLVFKRLRASTSEWKATKYKHDHSSSKFLPTLHPMRTRNTRPDGAHGPYTTLYVLPYYSERTNAAWRLSVAGLMTSGLEQISDLFKENSCSRFPKYKILS